MSNSSVKTVDGVKPKTKLNTRKKSRVIFYVLMMALPVLQFAIFYCYININSIILAFKHYELNVGGLGYKVTFAGFENFVAAWKIFIDRKYMITNSLILFAANTFIGLALAILFSYYVYKKYYAAGFFKVILFMPQIVSSVVFTLLFKYIVTDGYIAIAKLFTDEQVLGLLDNVSARFTTIVVYNIWVGFGVNVLLFSGSMADINESVVESGELDGVNSFQELWFITLPMIYQTFISFTLLNIAGIFTNQMHLFSLYGSTADDTATLGYYLYVQAQKSDVIRLSTAYLNYSELSALGVILTLIIVAITLVAKKLMTKFGPSVD